MDPDLDCGPHEELKADHAKISNIFPLGGLVFILSFSFFLLFIYLAKLLF